MKKESYGIRATFTGTTDASGIISIAAKSDLFTNRTPSKIRILGITVQSNIFVNPGLAVPKIGSNTNFYFPDITLSGGEYVGVPLKQATPVFEENKIVYIYDDVVNLEVQRDVASNSTIQISAQLKGRLSTWTSANLTGNIFIEIAYLII